MSEKKFIIKAHVISNVGKVRNNNEDNYNLCGTYRSDVNIDNSTASAEVCEKPAVFAVFDGMGGASYGEEASLIAASEINSYGIEDVLSNSEPELQDISRKVYEKSLELKVNQMGTTVVAIYTDCETAIVTNVGDSRCYLLRDGTLSQISVDHNEAAEMVRMGIITNGEASVSNVRHTLTQYLGVDPEEFMIEPFYSDRITLKSKDRFLLCSDGITDMLSDDAILEILLREEQTTSAVQSLVDAALAAGGVDNITAMVVDIYINYEQNGELQRC